MEELQKKLDEIKQNIDRLKSITDALVRQKNILDKIEELEKINEVTNAEKIDKEVI